MKKDIEKLNIELEDMQKKYSELSVFLKSDEYETIPTREKDHLGIHIRAIGSYIVALQLRLETPIEDFNPEYCSVKKKKDEE